MAVKLKQTWSYRGSSYLQTYLLKPYFKAWNHDFSSMNLFVRYSFEQPPYAKQCVWANHRDAVPIRDMGRGTRGVAGRKPFT